MADAGEDLVGLAQNAQRGAFHAIPLEADPNQTLSARRERRLFNSLAPDDLSRAVYVTPLAIFDDRKQTAGLAYLCRSGSGQSESENG